MLTDAARRFVALFFGVGMLLLSLQVLVASPWPVHADTPAASAVEMTEDGVSRIFRIKSDKGLISISTKRAQQSGKAARIIFDNGIPPSDLSVNMGKRGESIDIIAAGRPFELWLSPVENPNVSIEFANGVVWSYADLRSRINGIFNAAMLHGAGALRGNSGDDIFIFDAHDGSILIDEANYVSEPRNVLQLGAGLDKSRMRILSDGADGIVLDFGGGDEIEIVHQRAKGGGHSYGIQEIHFADGTVLPAATLTQAVADGDDDRTEIAGDAGANTLDSKGKAHLVRGGGGGDTFIYQKGYGRLEIDESEPDLVQVNVLSFGTGIDPADVKVKADGDDIHLTIGATDDQIKLDRMQLGLSDGVQDIAFANREHWSLAYVLAMANGGRIRIAKDADPGVLRFRAAELGTTGVFAIDIEEDASTWTAMIGGAGKTDIILKDSGETKQLVFFNALGVQPDGFPHISFKGRVLDYRQVVAMAEVATPQNRELYGDGGANVLDSLGIAFREHGGGGGDTFLYKPGYGRLTIDESDAASNPMNVLAFGAGIDPEQMVISADNAGNVILQVSDRDCVILEGALGSTAQVTKGVQRVTFASGTSWTWTELMAKVDTGSPGNKLLFGDRTANTFDSHGFATYAAGQGGGDSFIFNRGYHRLIIDEADESAQPGNTLIFGPGIEPAAVMVSGNEDGDVQLSLPHGDEVDIQGQLYSDDNTMRGIQRVTFADGTSWTATDLIARAATGSAHNTSLYAGSAGTVFDSHGFAHEAHGGGNGDTFIYRLGYGKLWIDEDRYSATSINTLAFKGAISPGRLRVSADRDGNLTVTLNDADEITIGGQLDNDGQAVFGIQRVTFEDGRSMTVQELITGK